VTRQIRTHDESQCDKFPCPVHRPSAHHMRDWPLVIRVDWPRVTADQRVFVLTERTCSHGVGHPDPDSVDHAARLSGSERFAQTVSLHGCDGCCQDPESVKSERGQLP